MKEVLQPPETGQNVIVISIREDKSTICNAKVLFSRGKGIILETSSKSEFTNSSVNLFYASRETVLVLKGAVTEKIAKNRFYFVPHEAPKEMDKRDFMRTNLTLDMAVSRSKPTLGNIALKKTEVELSGSGIRVTLDDYYRENEKLFITIRTPLGKTFNLSAVVVRSVKMADSKSDIAARFHDITREDQEELVNLVFKKRYEEIGIV